MKQAAQINGNKFNACFDNIDIIIRTFYKMASVLKRFYMDISIRKLSTVFALSAGITAGGIIGVGTLIHNSGDTPAQIETTSKVHGKADAGKSGHTIRVAASNDAGVEALVLKTDGDVIAVRAHTWVGQFTIASVCAKEAAGAQHLCHYNANITDAAGTPLRNVARGQTVYLHGLDETGASNTPAAISMDIPNIRPRSDVVPGPVRAHVVKTVDGDTFQVMAEIWKGTYVLTDIRVNGIDTPEKKGRAKCESEAALAEKASAATRDLINDKDVLLYNVQYEKYGGRVLGDAKTLDGTSVAGNLTAKNLAKPYDGGTKQSWCR